jgi:hypothetical protein
MDDSTLPPGGSLALGVPPATPGTLFALTMVGGIVVGAREGRTVLFGRNRPDVDVCLGEDDQRVSRQHGLLARRGTRWWVSNTGQLPVRLPGSRLLFREEEPLPLDPGYTPVFIRGARGREHLMELYVTGADGQRPALRHSDPTQPPRAWPLKPEERMALVALGQRYLLHDLHPQPLSWQQAANLLAEVQPTAGWTYKRVEHIVVAVRGRLARDGVAGLTREEVGEPVGNALNDNLLQELMFSTTLVPPDLALLDLM